MTDSTKSPLGKFETLSKSVLNVVLSFSALAGGAWALAEFCLTQQVRRSAVDLSKLELERKQLERAEREASAFESTLDARARLGGDGGCAIVGSAAFRNRTAKEMCLDYREIAPLKVGRVALDDGAFTFKDVAFHGFWLPRASSRPDDKSVDPISTLTVKPGRSLEMPFVIPVLRPGLYMVMLSPVRSDRWPPTCEPGTTAAPIDSQVWLNAVLVEVAGGQGCG